MSTNVGIWLDRSKAIIVRIDDKKFETVTLSSDLEKARHPRCGTEGHCTLIPEGRLKQRKQEIVKKFYQKIIHTISNAGSIFIMGPGMAKTELLNEIDTIKQLRTKIIGSQTVDKMSPRQLELKVKRFFEDIIKQEPIPYSKLYAMQH